MKYDKIVELSKEKSKKKAKIVKKQLQIMLEKGEPITVRALEKATGFSNSFFYRNKEVKKAWYEAQRKQYKPCNGIDVIKAIEAEDRIIDLNITITRLEMKLEKMELYQKELIAENNRLKEELKKCHK